MNKLNSKGTLFAIGLTLSLLFPINGMARISKTVTITKEELMNKIKGGWAGQTIGVCYALPTEFRYRKEMIPDSVKMDLTGEQLKKRFNNDDIYMDAKFVEVIGHLGLDAPADSFATAFANAGFNLWHANQAARYNILNGIMPPKSGHWKYSMHSELEWLNPVDSIDIPISDCIVFSDVLVKDGIISNKWQPLRTLNEDGLLGHRVDLWRNHRLWFIAESGYLIDGFEERPGTHAWQGEHLGKWLHAATLAYQVTGDEKLKEALDDMVKRLIATQLPDGYLGTYPEEARFMNVPENDDPKLVTDDIETKKTRQRRYRGGWDTWTFRYNLYGLLTYEKVFPNEQVVDACKKMADLLINTYGTDKSDLTKYGTRKGISATTLLESIVMLYERTSDKKYLAFAEEIVRMSENNPALRLMGTMLTNGSVVHPGEGKGYQLMANLLGYLRLYRCTGNENYLKTVTYAWNDIHKNHILVTGGPWSRKMPYNGNAECFARTDAFHPEKVRVEGCCDATWIQLNIHLFEFTGEAKYMNEAEITLLNSVYGHQHTNGKQWCYFTKPNEAKMAYREQFHCCGSSEPRGMEMYSDHLAGTVGEHLSISSLFPAALQVANQFGGGHIKIDGRFPLESSAKIHMETLKKKSFTLEFRLPANTSLIHVQVNGQKITVKKNPRGFYELTRTWHRGDVIAVDMKFELKACVQMGEGNQKWVAFNYGPHALAQKISAIPSEEPFLHMHEKETSKMLKRLSKSSDSDIAFSIKETDITLIPYFMTGAEQSGPRTYFKLARLSSRVVSSR